jgi:hypothetical protein
MARDVVSRKLFEKIISSPKLESKNPQSVRNAISTIHEDNPGITMNAAAYLFAKQKGFGVYGSLSSEDKTSLQYLKSDKRSREKPTERQRRIGKVKEVEPDFVTCFAKDAYDNANIYPQIYILENTLREVIFEKFGKGVDWWNDTKTVKKDIQDYAMRIKEAEKKYPWMKERGDHPIWYVGLLELFQIIDKNWKPHFHEVFKDLDQLRAWIKESVPIRNYVAHNVKTRDQERQTMKKNTDYICRLVEKWRKEKGLS